MENATFSFKVKNSATKVVSLAIARGLFLNAQEITQQGISCDVLLKDAVTGLEYNDPITGVRKISSVTIEPLVSKRTTQILDEFMRTGNLKLARIILQSSNAQNHDAKLIFEELSPTEKCENVEINLGNYYSDQTEISGRLICDLKNFGEQLLLTKNTLATLTVAASSEMIVILEFDGSRKCSC
jgi:hypothetical protein